MLQKKADLVELGRLEESVAKRSEIKDLWASYEKIEKQLNKLSGDIKDVKYIATGQAQEDMTHSEEEELDRLEQELQEEMINESSIDDKNSHFEFKLRNG